MVSVFSALDRTIQSHSIKECYRLGRFNPKHGIIKPRPLLVRFVRMADVNCILSKRRNLSKPHYVKSDMTQEQCKLEAALLRERWNLIQSSVPRSQINIHNACIYVKKKLHGKVINYMFKSVTSTNSLQDEREYQPSDAPEPIPIVSHIDPKDPKSLLTFNSKSASFVHKEAVSAIHSVSLFHDTKAAGFDYTSKIDSFPATTQDPTATNTCNTHLLDLPSTSFSSDPTTDGHHPSN